MVLQNFQSNKLYFWRLNVLVFYYAANQYDRITGIVFKNFKSKWELKGLMKLRLQLKMLLIHIIFEWKLSMNKKNKEKAFFRYFCRFMSGYLTLRPRKMYVYVFPRIIWFLQFSSYFLFLIEARSIFIWFCTKSTEQPVCVHASVCFP